MGRREAFPENAGAAASAVAPRLPLSALLAMAMSGFVAILSETLPAGLLPQIGAGLAVSEALAGQLVSVYALGSLLAALPAASLTQGWRRRRVLLLALLIFFVCNSLTAVSSDYRLTLLARFGSGVAAGLAWGLLAGYARRLVPPEQQGRALAVAMLGAPLALSLGVPLGTWLGGLLGWRWAFGLLSLTALLLVGWVLRSVPDFPGQPAGRRLRLLGVLRTPGVRPVLLVIVAWVLAHNILYTYIAPFLAKVGLGASVDLALLVFGSAAVAGIWLVGVLVDRHLRRMVLASLALFAVAALALCLGARWSWLAFAGLALWGLTFGGAATLLQTASADAAGEGADLAQSMIVVRRSVGWHGVAALGQRDAALDPATADRLGRRAGLGQCRARFPRRPARLPQGIVRAPESGAIDGAAPGKGKKAAGLRTFIHLGYLDRSVSNIHRVEIPAVTMRSSAMQRNPLSLRRTSSLSRR